MTRPKRSFETTGLEGLFVGGDTVDITGVVGEDILRSQIKTSLSFSVFHYVDFADNRVIIIGSVIDLGGKIYPAKKDIFQKGRGFKEFDLGGGGVCFGFGEAE